MPLLAPGTHLWCREQRLIPTADASRLPVVIYVLGETLYAVVYGWVHRLLEFFETHDRRVIYTSIRLLFPRRQFEEAHDFLEVVFCALVGGIALLVEVLKEHIIVLVHAIWRSAAVLDGGGEADVCRWLREDWRVELVISEVTEDGLRGRNMGIFYFALGGGTDSDLQMEFL